MRVDFGSKPWTYPLPVYIIGTYDENGNANAMNAAWGGLVGVNKIAFCIDASHKTTSNFLKTFAFTVNIGTKDQLLGCDYVGIASGNKEEHKVEKAGFHVLPSKFVNAPIIEELGMSLECKVESYDKDTEILIGEIVNVSCDESYLTDGKIDPKKLQPLMFDGVHMKYYELGNVVGNAFQDGRKLMK